MERYPVVPCAAKLYHPTAVKPARAEIRPSVALPATGSGNCLQPAAGASLLISRYVRECTCVVPGSKLSMRICLRYHLPASF